MVRGNHVNGAVGQPLNNGCPVLVTAQGRIHLEIGVIGRHIRIREGEIMGSGFTGDRQPLCLGRTDGLNGLGRTHVAEMHPGARQFSQGNIAHHHDGFGSIGNPFYPHHRGRQTFVHGSAIGKPLVFSVNKHGQS